MLYVNRTFSIETREMSFGKLRGFALGERGRGRYEIFIPVPDEVEKLNIGMNVNMSVGQTRNGKPRINIGDDGNLYMIMSSEARSPKQGDGFVFEVKLNNNNEPKVVVLASANGADGEDGRIGSWEAKVLRVKPGSIIKVVWSGSGYGITPTYYFVQDNEVVAVEEEDIPSYYDLREEEMPEYFKNKFNSEE